MNRKTVSLVYLLVALSLVAGVVLAGCAPAPARRRRSAPAAATASTRSNPPRHPQNPPRRRRPRSSIAPVLSCLLTPRP